MKGTYDKSSVTLSSPYTGKDTGTETQTEQQYIPIAVQINRMIAAGEQLVVAKKEMYDLGWDEDFKLNKVKPHAINLNMDRTEMQEVLENAQEQIDTLRESGPTENEPESSGGTDIPTEEASEEPSEASE